MKALHAQVQKLLEEVNPYVEVNEGTRLLEEGVLTSLEIFAFWTLLEDTYDIEVPAEAVTKENFATIGSIASLIENLLGKK